MQNNVLFFKKENITAEIDRLFFVLLITTKFRFAGWRLCAKEKMHFYFLHFSKKEKK